MSGLLPPGVKRQSRTHAGSQENDRWLLVGSLARQATSRCERWSSRDKMMMSPDCSDVSDAAVVEAGVASLAVELIDVIQLQQTRAVLTLAGVCVRARGAIHVH